MRCSNNKMCIFGGSGQRYLAVVWVSQQSAANLVLLCKLALAMASRRITNKAEGKLLNATD